MKCKIISAISLILVVIGALNWGLWGFFQFDLVAWLCGGNTSVLSRLVYAIVGVAGVVSIKVLLCCKKKCACPCHKEGACHDKGSCEGSCSKHDKGCGS